MKLKIPFIKQTTALNCGPVALQMVLSYFGENPDIKEIEEKIGIKEGKGVSTLQIAIASASFGFKTKYYSKHVFLNKENLKLDYYKNYISNDLESSKKRVDEAKKIGVIIEEKSVSLEGLLYYVTKDSELIVLLNWNEVILEGNKGYQGHFVPIVGYDKNNIYVHNHGFKDPKEFLKIKRHVFDKARKSQGTDEDFVVIYRKDKK